MTSKGIERICLKVWIGHVVRTTTALVIFIAFTGPFLRGAGANLVDNSPFIPDSFNALQQSKKPVTKKATTALEFEFRGVYSLGGEYQFSIYNKKAQKGEWFSLGESGSAFEVTGYDENSNSIQLSIDGKIEEISLRAPDNKPIPVQTARGGTFKSRKELAAANRVARAKKKKPVVRRRVIVPNRKDPTADRAKNQAKSTRQRP